MPLKILHVEPCPGDLKQFKDFQVIDYLLIEHFDHAIKTFTEMTSLSRGTCLSGAWKKFYGQYSCNGFNMNSTSRSIQWHKSREYADVRFAYQHEAVIVKIRN